MGQDSIKKHIFEPRGKNGLIDKFLSVVDDRVGKLPKKLAGDLILRLLWFRITKGGSVRFSSIENPGRKNKEIEAGSTLLSHCSLHPNTGGAAVTLDHSGGLQGAEKA